MTKTNAAEEAKTAFLSFPTIVEEKRSSVFVLSVSGFLAGHMEKVEVLSKQIENGGKWGDCTERFASNRPG